MSLILWVAAGGAVGSVARHLIAGLVNDRNPPWGTAIVNMVGSLLLGVLIGWLTVRGDDPTLRVAVGVGLLGGFTTFSSWMVEAMTAWDRSGPRTALIVVAVPLVAGLAAAAVGLAAGRALS